MSKNRERCRQCIGITYPSLLYYKQVCLTRAHLPCLLTSYGKQKIRLGVELPPLFIMKRKKKRHNFDFSLIPLISHPLLIRDVPYSRAFILQVLLLLSNIPTDVLSVIPLVGYGETACNINKPTPEAGNQAWTHPEFSLPKVRSNTYSPKMLLVLSRMRHHAGWNTLLVRSGLQTCSNPFSTSKDDYAHLSLSIPPRTICSSSKVTFLST